MMEMNNSYVTFRRSVFFCFKGGDLGSTIENMPQGFFSCLEP